MAPSLKFNCKYYWWHTCVLLAKSLGFTCACLLVIAQLISQSAAARPSIYATMNSISPETEGLSWKWEETHDSRRTVAASVGRGISMTCVSASPHEDVIWRKRVSPEQNHSAAWLDMTSLCPVVRDPVNLMNDYTQSQPNREGHGRDREHCSIITVSYTSKGKERRNTTLAIHKISEDDFATYSCGPSEVRGSELGKDDLHAFVLLNDKNNVLRNYVEIEGRLKRSSKDSHSPWHIYTEEKLGKHTNDSLEGKIIILPFKARSQTATEGMSTEILCDINEPQSASKNEKFWYKDSNRLEMHTEEGRYNSSWNGTKFALVINSAKLEDRGIYNCSVFVGDQMVATSGILLRVKGKMAPLWPFITICVEVVILSIIILVYEKSKKKDKIEESDTDGSPDHKNVSENNDSSEASRLQKET